MKLQLSKPNYWNQFPAKKQLEVQSELLSKKQKLGELPSLFTKTEPFYLLDGPPYANGSAHLGHVVNKVLKDAFVQSAKVQGQPTHWQWGWDCHGLPLEVYTQQHNPLLDRKSSAFMSECRGHAQHWQRQQATEFEQVAASVPDGSWRTMDPKNESKALALLGQLFNDGLLVERHYPVHWCAQCGSSLATSELEPAQLSRYELWALAQLQTESALAVLHSVGVPDQAVYLAFWTTTPWTLVANEAFAFHPDTKFGLWQTDKGLVLASVEANPHPALGFMSEEPLCQLSLADVSSNGLSLRAQSPVSKKVVSLFPAAFVSRQTGTGFVHVAPAFGPEDYELFENLGMPFQMPVDDTGAYLGSYCSSQKTSSFTGLSFDDVGRQVVDFLTQEHLFLMTERKKYDARTCWRHNTPTFYKSDRQWCLDLHKPFTGSSGKGLYQLAQAHLEQVQFLPQGTSAKEQLFDLLQTRRFWNVSRNRSWGTPLPMLYHKDTGELYADMTQWWAQAVELVKTHGVEAYWDLSAPEGFVKANQCVDVWFDSGCAYLYPDQTPHFTPSMVLEGRDQTRGWFLSLSLLGSYLLLRGSPEQKNGTVPFERVFMHGFVVDEKGQKLSKSKGNAVSFDVLMQTHGPETLRLWVLSQAPGSDLVFSPKTLAACAQELAEWRNYLRFMLANLWTDEGQMRLPAELPQDWALSLRSLDLYALTLWKQTQSECQKFLNAGSLHLALNAFRKWRQFASSRWFDRSKRLLYCADPASGDATSLRYALLLVLMQSSSLLRVFTPLSVLELLHSYPLLDHKPLYADLSKNVPMLSTDAQQKVASALDDRDGASAAMEQFRENTPKGTLTKTDRLWLYNANSARWAQALGLSVDELFSDAVLVLEPPKQSVAGEVNTVWASADYYQCPRCRSFWGNYQDANASEATDTCARCKEELGTS